MIQFYLILSLRVSNSWGPLYIITEFLSLAKIKPPNQAMHNMNSILDVLHPLLGADAMQACCDLNIELGEIPNMLVDEKEIRQLVFNLVRNGFEAMPNGGNLSIRTKVDGDYVVLSVSDEGSGIEPTILEKLGTPFLTNKEYGTGLGLAVCYGIARRHNATIRVECFWQNRNAANGKIKIQQ